MQDIFENLKYPYRPIELVKIKATTLEKLLNALQYNKAAVAITLGVNRGTVGKWVENGNKVLIQVENGNLVPYVADRRNGNHKKKQGLTMQTQNYKKNSQLAARAEREQDYPMASVYWKKAASSSAGERKKWAECRWQHCEKMGADWDVQ